MKSLQTRILLYFSGLLMLAGAVIGYTIYQSSAGLIANSISMQTKAIAERAIKLIDADAFAQLSKDSGETDYYKKLRIELNELRQTNGLKYLYTLGRSGEGKDASYYYLVDGASMDAKEGEFSALGQAEDNRYPQMIQAFETGEPQAGDLSNDNYGATITVYVPIKAKDGKLLAVLGADYDATEIYATMQSNQKAMIMVSLGIFLASLLLVFLLARYLALPLVKLTSEVAKVRDGDLTVMVSIRRKDEIGRLADSFQQLVTDTRIVIQGIRANSEQLLAASASVSDHARETAAASRTITTNINEATHGADTQVKRAVETSDAMKEMATSMQRIAESSSTVAEVSQMTTEEAQRGNSSIETAMAQMASIQASSEQMVAATRHLQERSGEISEIITLLRGIATQTNLLALNAGIESARAGEEGKGFAVVAGEVRKLANQSQTSSQRITELIEAIVEQTDTLSMNMQANASEVRSGQQIVSEAGQAFHTIMKGLEHMNDQVQEVSAASQQVSAGSQQVAASVDEMEQISRQAAQHFQDVAVSSNTQLATMDEVRSSAEELRTMSEDLKRLVDRFRV